MGFLRHKTDQSLELERRRVEKEVAFAWNSYKTSTRRLKYLEDYVETTMKTGEFYFEQFMAGERTLLDVLNTENEEFEAVKQLLTVKYQNLVAKFRILASIGTLLETMNIQVMTDEIFHAADINKEIVNDMTDKINTFKNHQREIIPAHISTLSF